MADIPSFEDFKKSQAAIPSFEDFKKQQNPVSLSPGTPGSEIPGRIAGTIASDLNPMGLASAIRHPINAVKGMFAPEESMRPKVPEQQLPGDAFHKVQRALGGGPNAPGARVPEMGVPEAVGHAIALPLGGEVAHGLGKLVGMPAPALMEKALGVFPKEKMWGAQPGMAALEHTSGFRPETIGKQGQARIAQANDELTGAVNAPNAGKPSLLPARNLAESEIAKQAGNNATDVAESMLPIHRFLNEPGAPVLGHEFAGKTVNAPAPPKEITSPILGPRGEPITRSVPQVGPAKIAPQQPAPEFLGMRRGFDAQFGPGGTWTNFAPSEAQALAQRGYGSLTGELHRAVPGTIAPDKIMQDLIPVVRGAERTGLKEGVGPRIMTRMERPTGAMALPLAAAASGGLPAAAQALGLQEMISSPTPRIAIARALHGTGKMLKSPIARQIGRAIPLSNQNEQRPE